jgi:hypothetical protein
MSPASRVIFTTACLALALCACGSSTATTGPTATLPATPAAVATQSAAPPSVAPTTAFSRNPAPYVEGGKYTQSLAPAAFVKGISHPFFPMVPGAHFVFDGAEHVEVNVLAETKDILDVATTVVHDQVFEKGVLIEDTLDYYAQDVDGNVWYFGEATAEYENGKVKTTAGSWVGGVDGALPGIIMLAEPRAGDTYRQEFYAGEAEDIGMVTTLDGSISTKAGSWSGSDVLVTEEWTPLEPDVRERKTYARGVGIVETRTIKGGKDVTTLTSFELPT